MRRHWLISQIGPLVMLAAGLGFFLASISTLDLGSARRMGPGAYPMLVGGLLAVLSLITLVQNLRRPMEWDRADLISVASVVGGVAAFAFFTPILGVLPAVVLSVLGTSAAVWEFKWPLKILLGICVAFGVWLVFIKGLGIPLPAFRGM